MVFLVRFGELALKSPFVRRQLRDRLVANIQDLFAAEGVECITEADEARVYVHANDLVKAREILGRVFGVVSFSPAAEVHADVDSLRKAVLSEAARSLTPGQSFALRIRRVGTHPFTSQDLARDLGEDVRRAHPDVRVNLTHPDIEIHIEVRRNRAFVFREIWPGPGGLPLGSQGRALAVVRDDAGLVAAWMGMKRGCRVAVASDGEAFVEPLRKWDVRLKVLNLPENGSIEEVVRIARADAVFLGTRWNAFDPEKRASLKVPIFEPVIALGDEEVGRMAARIRAGSGHLPSRS
ncbi:MAG: THUMP domain-containing protein [Thermoplasmata archaeon]